MIYTDLAFDEKEKEDIIITLAKDMHCTETYRIMCCGKAGLAIGGFASFQANYYKEDIKKAVSKSYKKGKEAVKAFNKMDLFTDIPYYIGYIIGAYMVEGTVYYANAIEWVLSDYRTCKPLIFSAETQDFEWNSNFRFNQYNCKYLRK